MIRALLALLLVAPVAAAQVVPPDAKRLTDVACVLSGCDTGSGISGLTATRIPVATSATAVGDSAITHNSTTGVTTFGGSGPSLTIGAQSVTESNLLAAGMDIVFADFLKFVYGGSVVAYVTSSGAINVANVSNTGNLHMSSAGTAIGWDGFATQLKRDAAGQVGIYGAGSTYGTLKAAKVALDGDALFKFNAGNGTVDLRNAADSAYGAFQANVLAASTGASLGFFATFDDSVGIYDDGWDALFGVRLKNGAVVSWPNSGTPTTQIKRDSDAVVGFYGASSTYGTARAAIFATPAQTLTVLDSGDGSPAAATLTPTSGLVAVTCSDADGCNLTLGESGIVDGQTALVTNASANAVNLADTAGVSELTGAIALGQYDAVTLIYRSDRWIQTAPVSNN